MPRKGDPSTLSHATRGMKPTVKPNEQQKTFVRSLPGARQDGLRRALQIVKNSRQFIYDGSLAPTCRSCGALRENRRASKCNRCEASA